MHHQHTTTLAAALLLAAFSSRRSPVGGPCPADGGPTPFGPALTADDSGRVYASLLSRDGTEFFFFERMGPGQEDYRILRSVRLTDRWGPPAVLDLGPSPSDLYPSLSPDGRRLVFSSYRPVAGDTSAHRNAHLWMARRQGTGWSSPELLAASRIGFYHSGLRQDSVGTLEFHRTTPDWRRTERLRLPWLGSGFAAKAEPVPDPATDYWRARQGDTLYVWGSTAGPDGWVFLQISRVTGARHRAPAWYYLTRRQGSGWTDPIPAGGGLAEGAPNFLWLSADGCDAHYTRNYSAFVRVPIRLVLPGRR